MKTLSLKEFKEEYLNLSEDTLNAIKELEDLTGKEVIFRLIDSTETTGFFKLKIKLARAFMDRHIIIINTDAVKNKKDLNYLIVHEIMHGFRVFKAAASERKILASDCEKDAKLKLVIKDTIDFKSPLKTVMSLTELDSFLNQLILNMNTMLFNSSVDARIEMEIYNRYPNLRKAQKNFQKEYIKEIIDGFSKYMDVTLPTWVLRRVRLMSYCYLLKITPIIGKSWTSKVNSNIDAEFLSIVKDMMVYLDKEDEGQISDNETIRAWSEILGMKDYVSIVDFERVPFMYEYMN